MAGIFEITEGLVDDAYEFVRFESRQDGHEHWGVWDWEKKTWRREPNYTRREAAAMSCFLNREDRPGGLSRRT